MRWTLITSKCATSSVSQKYLASSTSVLSHNSQECRITICRYLFVLSPCICVFPMSGICLSCLFVFVCFLSQVFVCLVSLYLCVSYVRYLCMFSLYPWYHCLKRACPDVNLFWIIYITTILNSRHKNIFVNTKILCTGSTIRDGSQN